MPTLRKKVNLLRGLLTGDKARTGPIYVFVDVTRRCNLRCLGCRYHSPQVRILSPGDQSVKDMPFDLFLSLCDDLRALDTDGIILIGEGEPFLHPRIFDMISAAGSAVRRVTAISNGTLLNHDTVGALVGSRLDVLMVSLWASSPEEYKMNCPGTDAAYFDRVVQGLRSLSDRKRKTGQRRPRLVLHHALNRHNYENVERTAELALKTGCDALSLAPLHSLRGGLAAAALTDEERASLVRRLTDLKRRMRSWPLEHNIDSILLKYRIGEDVRKRYPCYIGWIHARVKVDGTVLPCNPCQLAMGNLARASFREIWLGEAFRSFRRQTLTREGLKALGESCDCGYCCHVPNNKLIHRYFRLFSPVVRALAHAHRSGEAA